MDTSEIYIKLCDCDEVQDNGSEFGPIIINHPGGCCNLWGYVKDSRSDGHHVWLPRQDQIQEMVFTADLSLEENHDEFIHWLWGGTMAYSYFPSEYFRFSSMEQLWISFYMYKKHQKTWDGEKWIQK